MANEQRRKFHERCFRESLRCWQSPEEQAKQDMSEQEAAYSTLEHAALRDRAAQPAASDPQPRPTDSLQQLTDKVRLIRTACHFAAMFALPQHFSRLLARDEAEPEDIEEVELVLSQIDGLDAVVDLSAQLLDGALESDPDTLADLAKARSLVAGMVGQLSARQDLVAVASRFLLPQRTPRYLPDGRPADWFTRMRQWDEQFQATDLADLVRARVSPIRVSQSVAPRFARVFATLLAEIAESDTHLSPPGFGACHTPAHEQNLAEQSYPVEGDAEVRVKLDLLFAPAKVSVQLGGTPQAVRRYIGFELFVPTSPVPLRGTTDESGGDVGLADDELRAITIHDGSVALNLLDAQGERYVVLLD